MISLQHRNSYELIGPILLAHVRGL